MTLNNYLISMILSKQPELHTIGIPVTVRQGDAMSNQVSAIAIRYKYLKQKSVAENSIRIQRKVRKLVENPKKKYFVLLFLAELEHTLIDAAVLAAHQKMKSEIAKKTLLYNGVCWKRKERAWGYKSRCFGFLRSWWRL